ncbi:MAG: hypothetical protein V4449_02390 [Patescibacteria group bacterium]
MAIIQPTPVNGFYRILRWCIGIPVVYLMLVPIVIADIFLEIYHHVAFPMFGIKKVNRHEYIRIRDRAELSYLTWYEKLNCAYCGYVNGWLHYASVIAGRTENYFCAVAHLETRGYVPSEHEKSFVKYGDEAALRRRYARHEEDFGG